MFTKALTSRDADDWDGTSNTTNPVESINRQPFKSKNNLNVILENIYLEDRIHAVKMVARSQDVNISYSVTNKKKDRIEKGSAQALWYTLKHTQRSMLMVLQTKLKTSAQRREREGEAKS